MKFRKNRKGFTIVELIIVIAVIGVLTAVLVPTIVHLVNKANRASDQSLVSNINKALAMREAEKGKKCDTMHEAVDGLKEYGYNLDALVTKGDQNLFFNLKENKFVLVEKDAAPEGEKSNYWRIQNEIEENQVYNVYAGSNFVRKHGAIVEDLTVGFDAGYHSFTSIGYKGSSSKSALIRSYGDQCTLTINASEDDVDYYGFARVLDVKAVKGQSLHLYGSAGSLALTSGHVKVEDTGIVFDVTANSGSIENAGYIAKQSGGTAVTGKAVGGNFEIGSLARLEAFRDTVNAGNDFSDIPAAVKLTADIKLNDGWKPIGEGNRQVGKTGHESEGTFFKGEFDGNGKTISNLNNKGFEPTTTRLAEDEGKQTYTYGLFALAKGASFHDLTLTDVDIDGERYTDAKVDSVAALVGYVENGVTIENVNASGVIKATDAAAGIVGRAYKAGNVSISKCTNNVTVSSEGTKAAGILGYVNDTGAVVTLSENINNGNITSGAFASGIVEFGTGNITIEKNTNNGEIHIPAGKTGVAYVAGFCNKGDRTVNALGNVNNGKAFVGNNEVVTKIVANAQNAINATEENIPSNNA